MNFLSEFLVAAENAGIGMTNKQAKHFISNLQDAEIFICTKDNVCVLDGDKYTDEIDFLCMNGDAVQVNLNTMEG